MRKFLPFSRRQPSLDRSSIHRGGWATSDRFIGKSMRRISATSLNTRSIQVVRGAYNIDLNKVDSSFTKLHRACLLNDDIQVKKHIYKVDNNSHDSSNRYPIHLATVNGNFAIIKLLIENQANPNVQDNEGNTPLIKSIECGHEHLVKYLLNNGANPNIPDLDNNTALHWAIMTESIIAVDALMSSKKCDLLLRNNKDETCLHVAVRSPLINTPTFEAMIGAGSDLNAKDQLGFTAQDIAQACNNKIALNAFNRCCKNDDECKSNAIECINQQQQLGDSNNDERQTSAIRMCEEYKLKYVTKNRENLDYEKRLIQLTAQIERLKLDMNCLQEQYDKLEIDNGQLSDENAKLKLENTNLMDQINKVTINTAREDEVKPPVISSSTTEPPKEPTSKSSIDLDKVPSSVECRGHEEFLLARAFLQERINHSKLALL